MTHFLNDAVKTAPTVETSSVAVEEDFKCHTLCVAMEKISWLQT